MHDALMCEHGEPRGSVYCALCRRADLQGKAGTPDGPLTPYAGSSGWSGTETSRERAEYRDRTGVTSKQQKYVMDWLAKVGDVGITWRDVCDYLKIHHGSASGILSNLHKAGYIERLAISRGGSRIYVLPEFIEGRPIDSHSSKAPKTHICPNCGYGGNE